eukprot:COSAG02_NODE_977_length_15502_cov_235.762838_14_plen_173_part_00
MCTQARPRGSNAFEANGCQTAKGATTMEMVAVMIRTPQVASHQPPCSTLVLGCRTCTTVPTLLAVVYPTECAYSLLSSNRYTSYTYSGLTVTPTAEVKSGTALGWTFPDTTDSDAVWQVSVTGTHSTALVYICEMVSHRPTTVQTGLLPDWCHVMVSQMAQLQTPARWPGRR